MVSRIKTAKPKPDAASKTARKADLTPPAVRAAAIIAYLAEYGPTGGKALAHALGYKKDTAHRFASLMCAEGHLHRTTRPHSTGRNQHVFNLGPAPAGMPAIEPDAARGSVERRPVVKAWTPYHHRDLWACAMFPVPAVLLEARP